MSEDAMNYGVSYIASASEELKVGDRVEVVNADKHRLIYVGCKGFIVENPNPANGCLRVSLDPSGNATMCPIDFKPEMLRKLPDKILFEDCDNIWVSRFKKIADEMVDTYKAKDETYGNAYQDGFNRFGAVQLVSRMYEKYCRIENLLVRNAENKVPDESVCDTLTDLAVQAIVLRTMIESQDVDFESVD